MVLKQQQVFDVKYNNFNNMSTNEGIANSFAQEEYLGLTSEKMARNREWKRRDASFQWEIEQILANGPSWRTQAQAVENAAAEMQAGGGGAAGAPAGGGESELPEFGPSPSGGEGEAPAGGAAPAGGTAPAGGAAPAAPAAGAPAAPAAPPAQ